MARKKKGGGGGGSWLDTYADMVTLLLCFFAVLLSMSNTDEGKFEILMNSFKIQEPGPADSGGGAGEGTGITTEGPIQNLDELYEKLKEYVEENNQQDAVAVEKSGDLVYIRFSSDLFFLPNQYTMLPTSTDTMRFIGDGLKACENIIRMVEISGHTAAVQGESQISDWRLSGERAATVAVFLEDQVGFDPNKMKIEGYGKRYPVADNSTEEGRRKNRRVEMLVIGENATIETPDVYESIQALFNQSLYPAQGAASDFLKPVQDAPPPEGALPPEAAAATPEAQAAEPATEEGGASTPPPAEPEPQAPASAAPEQ